MISVIMTYYNTPLEQLRLATQSVLSQRYKDIEFIIIDDGSTIVDNYIDSFITQWKLQRGETIQFIRNNVNKGHSESRNIGVNMSHGDYIYFIDSDDYILDNTLLILDQNMKGSKADISLGNFTRTVFTKDSIPEILIYNKYQAIANICAYNDNRYILSHIPQVALNATWNKLYKREVLEEIQFPTGHVRDDNATTHKIFWNCNKIIFTTLQTYYYRPNGSLSGEHLYENKDLILAHKDRLAFLQQNFDDEKIINNEKCWCLRTLLMTYLKMQDKDVLAELKQFVEDNPELNQLITCQQTLTHAKKVIAGDSIC